MDRHSQQPFSARSSLVRPYWVFMAVFAILTLFVTYLMVKVYQSSSLLAEAGKRTFSQEIKNRIAHIDAYFERLRSDGENLARNKTIQAYYQNRALGMSLEYGLSVAVSEVRDEFDRLLKTLNSRGAPVFTQITLLDSGNMSEIARTTNTDRLEALDINHIKQAVSQAEALPIFTVVNDQKIREVFLVLRVIYKTETKGYLVLELDLETLTSQLETDNSQNGHDLYLIVDSDGSVFAGASHLVGLNVSDLFGISLSSLGPMNISEVRKKIRNLNMQNLIVSGGRVRGASFYFLGLAPSSKYLGGFSTELWLMVFSALISGLLIMALFIYKSWADHSTTYGQLQEARDTLETKVSERTSELAQTNQLLQNEIIARSGVEESLRLSEARYRDLFEHASDLIITIDTHGHFNSVNGVVRSVLGYEPQEFLSLNIDSVIDPQMLAMVEEKFFSALAVPQDYSAPFELLARSKDGSKVWLELTSRVIIRDGITTGIHCIARNITERKQLESDVQEAQMKYRSVVDAFDGLIHISSSDYKIQFANQRLMERTGYDPVGEACYEVVHGMKEPCEWCISGKASPNGIYRDELRSPKDNRWYYVVSSPMTHQDGGESSIFLMHDIEEQKKAEAEREKLEQNLIQAQKMEAVGTLAGGIAHDFNNLLQVVLGYSEILLRSPGFEHGVRQNLEKIHRAAHQGSELVKNLLAFSRKAFTRLETVNINHHVEELFDLLERTIPKMIKIELHLKSDIPTIQADSGQIRQVMMNLALNARDAMPDGGTLRIETGSAFIGEDFCKKRIDVKPGDYVFVVFSDTGHGMDEETLEHMFEPFYTTKDVGKGTGLGLSMVFGIVKQHGGFINFDSDINSGSRFRIYLPVADAGGELSSLQNEALVKKAPSGETILLVDDEAMVRDLGADYLSELGYTVRTASNGRQALEIYQQNQKEISLVLLDLIMPEMSGRICLEELLRINPDVKVVIVSGYCSDDTPEDFSDTGARGFVSKPYDLDGLMRTIHKVLQEN